MPHTIHIRGIDNWPDVNLRNEPGLINTVILFRVVKGLRAQCLEVQADPNGDNFQGQVYQWFHLVLDDGSEGWARDDLLDIEGDGRPFGYQFYPTLTFAFVASTQVLADDSDGPGLANLPESEENEVCTATIRPDVGANIRLRPTSSSTLLTTALAGEIVSVLAAEPGETNPNFQWAKVRWNGFTGYIREDLLFFANACGSLPFNTSSPPPPPPISTSTSNQLRFEKPVRGGTSISGRFGGGHRGVDLAGATGLRIVAGGDGVVTRVIRCTKCTNTKPSSISQGFNLNAPAVLGDMAWGWGFGNFVVVQYAWDVLPATMQSELVRMGLPNVFAYVIYAHLNRIDIAVGNSVNQGTLLGRLGNTGNSTGPHLHVEVAVSLEDNLVSLAGRRRVDPSHMFLLN